MLLGELSLDGRVRAVRGVLPAVLAAKRDGWPAVVVPADNLAEASLVDGIDVWGVRTLRQLQNWLNGSADLDDRLVAAARRRTTRPTWRTWSGSPRPGSLWKWPPPDPIT